MPEISIVKRLHGDITSWIVEISGSGSCYIADSDAMDAFVFDLYAAHWAATELNSR